MATELLQAFRTGLEQLGDYPDSEKIKALTNFTIEHIAFAQPISEIIINRLLHPHTRPTYKKPVFYLIDSILKKVGGAYPMLFTKHFSEVFEHCFTGIPDADRKKLDGMFGLWEERKLLPGDLLLKMKQEVAKPQWSGAPVGAGGGWVTTFLFIISSLTNCFFT